jgi:hypothetical protein
MAIFFNSLLEAAQIDPATVRLMRHKDKRADKDRTPYRLWRDFSDDDFITYQARQNERNSEIFKKYSYWASFIVPPTNETLFVGLYKLIGQPSLGEQGVPQVHVRGAREENPYMVFPLKKSDFLREYEAKLVIEWGADYINWHQHAATHDKKILELRPSFKEEDWPGALNFIKPLLEIPKLPSSWETRLKEAKGIYLLTSPRGLYVGSARSIHGGFYQRWLDHEGVGGDAIRMRDRELSDYQVSILEVAGSADTDEDILRSEHLWIKKLQTVNPHWGLNSNPRGEPKEASPKTC